MTTWRERVSEWRSVEVPSAHREERASDFFPFFAQNTYFLSLFFFFRYRYMFLFSFGGVFWIQPLRPEFHTNSSTKSNGLRAVSSRWWDGEYYRVIMEVYTGSSTCIIIPTRAAGRLWPTWSRGILRRPIQRRKEWKIYVDTDSFPYFEAPNWETVTKLLNIISATNILLHSPTALLTHSLFINCHQQNKN